MTPKQKTIVIMLWTITCLLFIGNVASADDLTANFDGKCLSVVWSSDIDEIGQPYMISIRGYDRDKLWAANEIFVKKDLKETRKICYSYEMDPQIAHITITISKLGETVATKVIN